MLHYHYISNVVVSNSGYYNNLISKHEINGLANQLNINNTTIKITSREIEDEFYRNIFAYEIDPIFIYSNDFLILATHL